MDRRNFIRSMIGGTALSAMALNDLNASIYEDISSMNSLFSDDQSPDGVYWDKLRTYYMFTDEVIMMNNGTVGPMPRPVFNSLMKAFEVQACNPYDTYSFLPKFKEGVRTNLAKFINASPDEVAIVRNTTEGMNTFAAGLEMQRGDEVLISTLEHPSGINPWKMKEARHGIKIKEVKIGAPPKDVDEIISAFEDAITSRTKVISISHTIFITGLIFPTKELCEMAHKKDILVLVDSAHGFGMLDLDMKELGIDAFCSSVYKWGGAPC
ncbi:MAG: aminotransferase class V-fold PLP-dependent enzyme, partial [bacterium]|nr:aminotransferase class V-fold PLP-dependent enzyme [bacterium]